MSEGKDSLLFETDSLYRLGLVRQPFRPGVVFEDAALATQMNVAVSLLQSAERILVVQGGTGLGKTTFLDRVQAQNASGLEAVRLTGSPDHGTADLLGALAASAGDAPRGPITRDQVVTHVRGSRRAGSRPLLLLDDAHRVPPPALTALLALFEEMAQRQEGFSLILTLDPAQCEGDWRVMLPRDLPAERLHEVNLYPFSETQTRSYLVYRLEEAGAEEDLFSNAEHLAIHERSGGRPDRIHEEAYDLLSRRLVRRQETRPGASGASPMQRRPWLRVALAAGAGAVAGGAVLVWFVGAYMTPSPSMDEELELPGVVEDVDEPPEAPEADEPDSAAGDGPARGGEESGLSSAPFGLPVPEHYTFSGGVEQQADDTGLEDEVGTADPAESRAATEDGVGWVESADPERYTIQLLAAGSPETLQGYAEHHGVGDETELVRTTREGEAWYLLLHGDHPDRDAAREALEGLDGELRERGPWVRTLGSVQEALDD